MKIVIPQAVKNILPTLGNEFIALIKETSVVSFVGATRPLCGVQLYRLQTRYEFMVPYLAMALIYIRHEYCVISLGIKLMERGLKRSGQTQPEEKNEKLIDVIDLKKSFGDTRGSEGYQRHDKQGRHSLS